MSTIATHFRVRLAGCLVMCLALAACAPAKPRVNYDFDPLANFTALKQFAWLEPTPQRRPEDPLVNNTLLEDRIKSVIEHQLLLKGITRAETGKPDFLVSFQAVTRKHAMTTGGYYPYGPYGMGFGYGRGPWFYDGWYSPNAYWSEYETHALIVDFLNPDTRKQIWRGILQDAFDLTDEPGEQKYLLNTKVQFLFRNFPPGPAH